MSNFFSLVTELESLLKKLNAILAGNDDETVDLNGVTKDTISKAIKDRFNAIQSMVQGRKAFATKALMDSDLNHSPDTLAEVWNDPVTAYNGLYGKVGISGDGKWEKSSYDYVSEILDTNKIISSVVSQLSSLDDRVDGLGISSRKGYVEGEYYPFIITDEDSKAAIAIDTHGKLKLFAGIEISKLEISKLNFENDSIEERQIAEDYSYAIVDDAGKVAFGISKTGEKANLIGVTYEERQIAEDYSYAIVDEAGKVAFGIDKSGHVVGGLENKGELRHFLVHGQSLGAGEESSPPVTTSPSLNGSLMFARGERTWIYNDNAATPEKRASSDFNLVPLVPTSNSYLGELCANGLCDHANQLLSGKYKLDNAPSFLFSFAAQGGRYLRELDKRHDEAKDPRAGSRQSPGGYYITAIDDVKRAKAKSDALGFSYNVAGIFWVQGEANGTFRINRWDDPLEESVFNRTYADDLKNLADDFINDIKQITGQKSVPFITYQTRGIQGASVSQLIAAEEHEHIYVACPIYQLPSAANSYYLSGGVTKWGDNIHLSADGERWMGEQFAKVQHRIHNNEAWQPLKPLKALKIDDTTLRVSFHVPRPPLVIDTDALPEQRNIDISLYGLDITTSAGVRSGVVDAYVIGSDTVEVKLKNPMLESENYFVQYGGANLIQGYKFTVDSVVNVNDNVEITLDSNHDDEVSTLLREGVFTVYRWGGFNGYDILTGRLRIRSFRNDAGKTVMIGEIAEAIDQQDIVTGSILCPGRMHSYGNLRDSDSEESTFSFGQGVKAGQKYPLHNWCVQFKQLEVEK